MGPIDFWSKTIYLKEIRAPVHFYQLPPCWQINYREGGAGGLGVEHCIQWLFANNSDTLSNRTSNRFRGWPPSIDYWRTGLSKQQLKGFPLTISNQTCWLGLANIFRTFRKPSEPLEKELGKYNAAITSQVAPPLISDFPRTAFTN